MLPGLALFYVGAVLILNGLWLLGHICDREISIINFFAGGITLLISLQLAFGPSADANSIKAAAYSLLFSFTYLWVALNRHNGADGRGLGWFSLFVAISAVPISLGTIANARTGFELWFGISWAAWSVLWLQFFLLLALKKPLSRIAAWTAIVQGIFTGWVPGYLLLNGMAS